MGNEPKFFLSDQEANWQENFLKIPVAIHGIVQLAFTLLIIILEIASLATSVYLATGAGIWCSIFFMTAAVMTILLGRFSLLVKNQVINYCLFQCGNGSGQESQRHVFSLLRSFCSSSVSFSLVLQAVSCPQVIMCCLCTPLQRFPPQPMEVTSTQNIR